MKHFVGFLAAVMALAAMPVAPAAADELEPSGDWSLDYADDSCALRRTFGKGEDRVWLEIMQLAPWYPPRITIAGTDFGKKRKKAALDQTPILRFLPAGTEEQYGLFAFGDYGEELQGLAVYAPLERALPSAGTVPHGTVMSMPTYLRVDGLSPAMRRIPPPSRCSERSSGISFSRPAICSGRSRQCAPAWMT